MDKSKEEKEAEQAEKKRKAEAKKRAAAARPRAGKRGQVPLFLIKDGDPFIDGTIRTYKNAGGKAATTARPFVLLASDKSAARALISYQVRANGACDLERGVEVAKAISAFADFAGK